MSIDHIKLGKELINNPKYKETIDAAVSDVYDSIVEHFNITKDNPHDERQSVNAIIRYTIMSNVESTLMKKAIEIDINRKL